MLLQEVHDIICSCQKCPLWQGRTNAVPGEGPVDAQIMFVGEGPGEQEDLQGRPFVGPAGQLLDELLRHVGFRREQVFITNLVKCRPPGNRTPLPAEVDACHPYLVAQIATVKPLLLVPLGGPALQKLIDPKLSISQVHGRVLERRGLRSLPLYHPAAALHRGNLRQTLFEDMLALRRAMQAQPGPGTATPSDQAPLLP